jgi:hypothetical protein
LNARQAPILLVALLALSPYAAQCDIPQWPAGTKEAAIAGCRASVVDHAEQDYLKRNNLQELPAGFREKSAPVMEPFLAVCGCLLDRIEKEWSFEYFSSHRSELPAKTDEILARECTPAIKQSVPTKTP